MAEPAWTRPPGDASDGLDADLAFAHELADAADAITREAFVMGGNVDHEVKPDGTPVSDIDLEVEQALLEIVRRHRPDDAVLGEEVGAHGAGHRRWMIDGIDGTSSFVTGSPLWSTLIGMVEGDVPVLGVKSSPAQGRRWWGARDRGAWSCDYGSGAAERLVVGGTPPSRITACVDLAWVGHPTRPVVDRLIERVDTVPMTTHPGFMVAAGDVDLAIQVAGGPWDFAGVMPVVWEAGGRCLDLDGNEVHVPQPPMVYVGSLTSDALRDLFAD